MESTYFSKDSNDPNERYTHLTETFLKAVYKYVLLNKKVIYTRSRLKNNFWKNPTLENERL